MRHHIQILALRVTIAAVAQGAWMFWRLAAWRSSLQTKLDNLQAGNEQRG
jgi:hypothetical protein